MGIEIEMFGVTIHDTVVNSWIIVLLLSIFSVIVGNKIKNTSPDEKPKGIVNIVEMIITTLSGLVDQTMGKGKTRDRLKPYIFTLAMFIASANLFGLLGFSPPTSDYNVTLGMTIITFGLSHYYSVKTNKLGGYIKTYFEPIAIMFPLNVVGTFADPISLSFRLFGNILAGGIIMSLVYNALGWFAPVASPLHGYFDVFGGLLQTFIFMMLSMVFISGGLPDEELDV